MPRDLWRIMKSVVRIKFVNSEHKLFRDVAVGDKGYSRSFWMKSFLADSPKYLRASIVDYCYLGLGKWNSQYGCRIISKCAVKYFKQRRLPEPL